MRPRPKTLGFASLLTLLAALYLADAAGAASVARQCRKACGDEVAACVGAGGHPRACHRSVLGRCKREGVAACQGEALAPALAGSCSSPTVLPAQGGTFGGATSGTSALAGSCGSSGTAPEQVFQWTPAVPGTATIQTCGAGTTFDTVLYMRSGACASGPEMAAGGNDDACTNATGLYRASRLTPTVTAGQTYYIVVDGYGGAQGLYGLTVTPPAGSPTTTSTRPPTTTTTTTRPPPTTTTTTRPPTTTTTTRPPTTTTTTRPPTTTTTTRPPTTTTTTLVGSGGFMSGILTDPTVVLSEPNLPKPAYLVPVVPSPFGVPCMRDGSNVGLSTSPVSGSWGSDARHVYSKQEPWSADESLISIENSGGPSPLILDGFTYLPKYAPCSNYDLWDYRWHPSRAHPHEQINVDSSGTRLSWFDVVSCTETRSWTLPIASDYGIGSGEGNPSNDGRFVLIASARQIYVVDMDPQPPFAPYPNQRIGPALDVSDGGSIDWAGMSASGKYAVVSYNGDYPRVFDVNTSTLALTPHAMPTSSYRCHGTASAGYIYALGHADVAINPFDSNEDVLVGRDQCFVTTANGVIVS